MWLICGASSSGWSPLASHSLHQSRSVNDTPNISPPETGQKGISLHFFTKEKKQGEGLDGGAEAGEKERGDKRERSDKLGNFPSLVPTQFNLSYVRWRADRPGEKRECDIPIVGNKVVKTIGELVTPSVPPPPPHLQSPSLPRPPPPPFSLHPDVILCGLTGR